MDISEELEAAVPHGPALPDPAERVAAGRAGLRRRRALVGTGTALAVAAVVFPAAVLAAGGDERGAELLPAAPVTSTGASATAVPPPTARPSAGPESWPKGEPPAIVDYTRGEGFHLRIRDGVVVHERRTNIYPGKGTHSVALDLTFRGAVHWVLLEWDEGGAAGSYGTPGDGIYSSFEEFVARVTQAGGMRRSDAAGPGGRKQDAHQGAKKDAWPTVGHVAGLDLAGDRFVLEGGGTILEQRLDPRLPDSFTEDSDVTAAAYVEQAGVEYLVLYRGTAEAGQTIIVESAGHGDSLDELLGWARERYRDGAGML